jgi:hypothetical protein
MFWANICGSDYMASAARQFVSKLEGLKGLQNPMVRRVQKHVSEYSYTRYLGDASFSGTQTL